MDDLQHYIKSLAVKYSKGRRVSAKPGGKRKTHDFELTGSRIAGFKIWRCKVCGVEGVEDSRGIVASYDERGGVNNQNPVTSIPCGDDMW
mgnify:CR=1 FL=1